MAVIKIPQYERQVTPQARGATPQMNQIDVSSGLESIGRSIAEVGDAIERKRLDDDAVAINKIQSEAEVQWSDWMNQSQDNWKRGGKDLPAQFFENFDKWQKETSPALQTKEGKRIFEQRMRDFRTALGKSAVGWQASTNEKLKLLDLGESRENMKKTAAANPALAEMVATRFVDDTNNMILSPEQRVMQQQAAKNEVAFAAEIGAMEKAGEVWKPDDKRWSWSNLTFEQQTRLKDMAEAQKKQRQAVGRNLFDERVRDATAMYLDGEQPPQEISRAEFVAHYGEEGGYRYDEMIGARDYGQVVSSFSNKSADEMEGILRAAVPKPGDGYAKDSQRFDAMKRAAKQVIQQREKDPGLYGAQSFVASVAKSPEAQILSSLAVQERWGISNPKPLPKEVASEKVAELTAMQGNQVTQELAQMQEDYGKAYPKVFAQLSEQGLPPAYVALGLGMSPAPAALLAEVANVDMKELKASVPSGISPKDITQALAEHAVDFNSSLVGMPGSEKTYNTMIEAAERLAYRYVRQNGESAESATEKAWEAVIGDKYRFEEVNGNKVRIPETQPADNIRSGMQAALGVVSEAMIDKSFLSGPGYKPEQLTATIQSRGYFVTTEEEDGAYLFMDGRPVPGPGGELIKFTWQQFLDPGRIRKAPAKYQEPLSTGGF